MKTAVCRFFTLQNKQEEQYLCRDKYSSNPPLLLYRRILDSHPKQSKSHPLKSETLFYSCHTLHKQNQRLLGGADPHDEELVSNT